MFGDGTEGLTMALLVLFSVLFCEDMLLPLEEGGGGGGGLSGGRAH